ncbi:MAG TPA: endonuclease/exonuclease/phosphatase family protein, partial [Pirellulales bacterium]|nr:endonuclease/exonuclease/phosphatase family protein [Pirellulales bacterium]
MTIGVVLGGTATADAGTFRIVTYNIEADTGGFTAPRSGLYQVLEGIGEELDSGIAQPVDVVALQETTSNSATVAPIVSNLNAFYNGAAIYAQSPVQGTQNGGASSGNGPNAVVYNTKTLQLVASIGIGTPQGSGNGEYRQVMRYQFRPVGGTPANDFYVYVCHMKSSASGNL